MLKLLTIIGARPQIIKSAAISRVIKNEYADCVREVIVHTGQHYDPSMSAVFFSELHLPEPDYNLQVGSDSHGVQTARMIIGIEEVIQAEKPDCLIIYGDTNSTLAGAIAAAKLHVPIVHVEAGLRSFNKQMPEEINRILADHVSTFLFTPTQTGYTNLLSEGFRIDAQPPYTVDNPGLFQVGDVMYDNSLYFSAIAAEQSTILHENQLEPNRYVLVTIHRNANTDQADRLNAIFTALQLLTTSYGAKLVIPVHPRTAKQMAAHLEPKLYQSILSNPAIVLLSPVSFLDMICLEQHAKLVITDSGGVQKEAYFFNKYCLVLRAETEWVELVAQGAAKLCDADPDKIVAGFVAYYQADNVMFPALYGDGQAARKIIDILIQSV
ncbi:UDP-N-acetylglucosamine 2-epimerase (non-hydrolyzing) [Spirosoma knui]